MSDHLLTDRAFINSIVGEGTSFKGDLNLTGLLRIDGDFSGSINTEGKVLIGKKGRAQCMIAAGTVVVGGILKGDIHSTEKVIVLSTGMIIGNVTTPRIVIEDGVLLHGTCQISASPQKEKKEPKTEKPEAKAEPSVSWEHNPEPETVTQEQPEEGAPPRNDFSAITGPKELYSWKG